MSTVANDGATVDDHVGHVRCGRGVDDRGEGRLSVAACGARRAQVDGDEIGRCTELDPPGLRPAERTVAVGSRGVAYVFARDSERTL